ncbi:TetR/AcrR family transcriptional regulator [Azospirillum cavernae]|nr:TetR/AcrR family transcriptional regulator [Azospirillum cavernae]
MATRVERKQASLLRILDAAAARLRTEGLMGAAIGLVMRDAKLTHGAFYSHFANKEELTAAAFRHALANNRTRWTTGPSGEHWPQRLTRLAKRYLTPAHRDDPANGCAFAAVASEAARSPAEFRRVFEAEMIQSLRAICGPTAAPSANPDPNGVDPTRHDEAIALLALCVGGVTLARAVEDGETSARVLAACQAAAARLANPEGATDSATRAVD